MEPAEPARLRTAEYRRLKTRSSSLAILWLSAHWLSQFARLGIVLVPLAAGVYLMVLAPSKELGRADWLWRLGEGLLGSLASASILVCSVALKSYLAKRGGTVNWDE